ncbi:paraquat-inducible protein A [Catenovulum sediminis]|uniref:Paraquat-inducible protein A n=1 Tax=Catenovulum sediminis TaxID=1740262 RepID=A0ABV1RH67_9ALTE|nr:paraquat-inducible protein A [Catenovulum sediminis]
MLHTRKINSVQKTLAWLITAVIFYIPANLYPVMSTSTLGRTAYNTIVGGVVELWNQQAYFISVVIFFASIVIPIGKILVLMWLCLSLKLRIKGRKQERMVLYRITLWFGRWSMIDVFVVAILVSLMQLGGILKIEPGIAIVAFAVVVVTTMLAAEAFDPRLIWDQEESKENHANTHH